MALVALLAALSVREQLEESSRSAHQVLSEVHDEARQALAAMRRTLGFLRSDRSAPDPAPAQRSVRHWALPMPTLSGLGLAGRFRHSAPHRWRRRLSCPARP